MQDVLQQEHGGVRTFEGVPLKGAVRNSHMRVFKISSLIKVNIGMIFSNIQGQVSDFPKVGLGVHT